MTHYEKANEALKIGSESCTSEVDLHITIQAAIAHALLAIHQELVELRIILRQRL